MKKKVLALVLSAALAATAFTGCGKGSDKADSNETIMIGFEAYDTGDEQFLAIKGYLDTISADLNIQMVYSENLASASDELNFIEECATKGCKGIIGYYNLALDETVNTCIDNEMYYWGTEAIYDQFANEEYYVGCYRFADGEGNGDYLGGYNLAYSLAEAGCKHVFYCNGGAGMGVPMFIDRQNGFLAGIAAAQADGMEISFDLDKDVIEGWPDADTFAPQVEEKLGGDYDGAASAFNVAALFQPLGQAGKLDGSFKLSTIGEVSDTYTDFVNAGAVVGVVYDCEEVVFANAIVSLVNAIRGNRLTGADGKALKVACHRWVVSDADTYNKILEHHKAGKFFVTAEDMLNLIGDDVTGDQVNAFYSSFTAESAVASL